MFWKKALNWFYERSFFIISFFKKKCILISRVVLFRSSRHKPHHFLHILFIVKLKTLLTYRYPLRKNILHVTVSLWKYTNQSLKSLGKLSIYLGTFWTGNFFLSCYREKPNCPNMEAVFCYSSSYEISQEKTLSLQKPSHRVLARQFFMMAINFYSSIQNYEKCNKQEFPQKSSW